MHLNLRKHSFRESFQTSHDNAVTEFQLYSSIVLIGKKCQIKTSKKRTSVNSEMGPSYLELERLIEDRIERLPVNASLKLPFPVGEQIDLDVGVGGTTQVHGSQILGLVDSDDQEASGEVVFDLEIISVLIKCLEFRMFKISYGFRGYVSIAAVSNAQLHCMPWQKDKLRIEILVNAICSPVLQGSALLEHLGATTYVVGKCKSA